jgi:GT2 family glycosyltransferase
MTMARALIVIPTLGERPRMLEDSILSVLSQGSIARCLVVVPEAASQAVDLVTRLGVEWVKDPGGGIAAATNAGIRAHRGEEFYGWLGDDDLLKPGALEKLSRALDTAPLAVLAYGGCDYILEDGQVIGTSRAGPLASWLLAWGPDLIPHPGTLFRLRRFEDSGLYDEQLRYTFDLDALLRLKARGELVCTSDVVSAFRWHPESLTVANRRASSAESILVKKRHLPPALRLIHGVWSYPVALASAMAARLLTERAKALMARKAQNV